MSKVQLNLIDDINEVVFREGQAPKVPDPIQPIISGDLSAPANVFYSRKDRVTDNSVVEFNLVERMIKYRENLSDPLGLEVYGYAHKSNWMRAIRNLLDKKMDAYELGKQLKLLRSKANDKAEFMKVVQGLQDANINVNQVIEQSKTNTGSVKDVFIQDVEHQLQLQFTMYFPVFSQGQKEFIPFEIEMSVEGKSIYATLISYDLEDIIEQILLNEFERQKERFGDSVIIVDA